MTTAPPSIVVNDRPYVRPDIDYRLAFEHLWCFPGKALFVTPRHVSNNVTESGVHLPDTLTARRRLPIATCIQAHRDTGLIPGETYVVHQRYAKRVKNIQLGRLVVPEEVGEVWMFGVSSPQRGTAYPITKNNYVYAKVNLDSPVPMWMKQPEDLPYWFKTAQVDGDHYGAGGVFVRVGRKMEIHGRVVLSLGKRKEASQSGILLPNSMKARPDIALIESVSPLCKTAEPGIFAWYQRRALDGLGLTDDDFGVIAEDGIFAAIDLHGLA